MTGVPNLRPAGRVADLVAAILTVELHRRAKCARPAGGEAARDRLADVRRRFPGRKVVFFYWQQDVLGLFVLARAPGAVTGLLGDVELACDDTFGGRVTVSVLRRLGGRWCRLSRSNLVERARDLQAIVRSPEPMGIAVDGNGPYGRVGREFSRLLTRCRAVAVPVAVECDRWVSVRARARMKLPCRDASVALGLGETIDGGSSVTDLHSRLEAGLAEAAREARSCLAAAQLLATLATK